MIVPKALFPIFLFVTSALAEEVYDPCSKFLGDLKTPLVKCPSEKSDDDYLECYDLFDKEYFEEPHTIPLMYWCWSRRDNNDDVLKDFTISARFYDNSELNNILNRPFTAKFHVNESHIICQNNEEWESIINDHAYTYVHCSTSTEIPAAYFHYTRRRKL